MTPESTAPTASGAAEGPVAHYCTQALSRYCSRKMDAVLQLPVESVPSEPYPTGAPEVRRIALPEWAADVGVDGMLLVPSHLIAESAEPTWQNVAWFDVMAWYLHGTGERRHEAANGPVHSFASRLHGWPGEIWDYAWVNRVALFLRRWTAHTTGTDEQRLFGPLPDADIRLTHDVDYVDKTWDFRVKQMVHCGREALSHPVSGLRRMSRMVFGGADYQTLDTLMKLEGEYGVRSVIHFYGGPAGGGKSLKEAFVDPAYDVCESRLADSLVRLRDGGWTIGLHQAFNSWRSAERMAAEKRRVEQAAHISIEHCRQHWLRFSWRDTWQAQTDAGFRSDATLGFNDRPGFRNAAALAIQPWNDERREVMEIDVLPLVVMDAQVRNFTKPGDRVEVALNEIARWTDEIRAVHGIGTVTWHPHTLHADFADAVSYEDVLRLVA